MKKLSWVPLIVLIVALVFVGTNAFGDVNQFEIEAGLTVETLMFPEAEKAVEMTDTNFVAMPLAESVVNQYMIYMVIVIAVAALFTSLRYSWVPTAKAEWGVIRQAIGVRIFGPLSGGQVTA